MKPNRKNSTTVEEIKEDKTDQTSVDETKKVEEEIGSVVFKKIKDSTQDIDCEIGGEKSGNLSKLKKTLYPQTQNPLTAMLDSEGNQSINQ